MHGQSSPLWAGRRETRQYKGDCDPEPCDAGGDEVTLFLNQTLTIIPFLPDDDGGKMGHVLGGHINAGRCNSAYAGCTLPNHLDGLLPSLTPTAPTPPVSGKYGTGAD